MTFNLSKTYIARDGEEKSYSKATLANYKSFLNKLAKEGYDTPELLIEQDTKVLELIKTLSADSIPKLRTFLCAVFLALREYTYIDSPNIYYQEFLKLKNQSK
jgi:hypothetical protein